MVLYIKYMVSLRCKMIVKSELEKLGLRFVSVDHGMVEILDDITELQRDKLRVNLLRSELELLDDKNGVLLKKIFSVITEMIHYSDELPKLPYSEYISKKLKIEYSKLADIFSEVNGITIEQFITINKIEKAKELLLYDELDLTEIAQRLNYTNVATLSAEFKKITGLSPSFFKELKQRRKGTLKG